MKGVFLQVRLDSSRLPGKAVLVLEDRTVIEHAMTALRRVEAGVFALLTDEQSSSTLYPLAERCGYSLFAGDKDDVLKRYADAAVFYKVDTIVRATGDNPLVSGPMAARILDIHLESGADFSCFTGMPLGTGVEVVKTEALLYASENSSDPYEREHVNPYLYRRDGQFFINRIPSPPEYYLPEARVTLDTDRDFAFIKRIYSELYNGHPVELDTLVPWLRKNAAVWSG